MPEHATLSSPVVEPHISEPSLEPDRRLRLLMVMAHGSAGALPEAWRSYTRIDEARAGARAALRNPQVSRVGIVQDGSTLGGSINPLRLVEWVE